MLATHLKNIEEALLAQSQVAQTAGHPNLRGGPREWFIHDFLESHLPSVYEIGQGEIIDANSVPNPPKGSYRHQVDIVVYRRDVPKIPYSHGHTAFLVEGTMATIESKSVLTQAQLRKACSASVEHKRLRRLTNSSMSFGYSPGHIVSYCVAYDGPASMATVAGWIPQITTNLIAKPEELVDMVVS